MSKCFFNLHQLSHLCGLLSSQCYLCSHDSLSLHHQQAVRALTVSPSAESLVSLQARHDAVVPTPCALRCAAQLALVSRRQVKAAGFVFIFAPRVFTGGCKHRLVVALGLQALYVYFKLRAGMIRHVEYALLFGTKHWPN